VVFATPQVKTAAPRQVHDDPQDVQWARALVNAEGGALYMASTVASRTRATLLSLGMPADTPATWIVNVSLPNQSVLATTLGELKALPDGLAGQPALLLLGTAVPSPWHEPRAFREPATATISS
jgi:siroheme synthase